MKFFHIVRTAFTGLKSNKGRSALTILGIVIGITAIMIIMSAGKGAQSLIINEISGLGSEIIVIRPGKEPKGPTDLPNTLFADSLKDSDVALLKKKENVPGLSNIVPAIFVPGSVSFAGETFRATIFGWSAEFLGDLYNTYPEYGVFFDENDIRFRTSVAVIGAKVKKELFGPSDALGQNIKIKNKNFKVVGILASKGQAGFFNIDEVVVVPYTTAQSYLMGINHYHEIIAQAKSPELVDRTVFDIEATLRQAHNITDPDKDDFFIVTQEGMINQVNTIIEVLTAFLTAVVAISLVVGGIGVMNIMLVSVTERTREIGLRKALGATEKDIMFQFLFESIMLTGVGGIIGILFGASMSLITSIILSKFVTVNWVFNFPMSAALLGLFVSVGVGLAFGIYPARQAAKKNPIDALRYE